MITKNEIQEKAKELGVQPQTIDKDWVLGHLLKGIFEVKELSEVLVFKGGTCLKKCYFPEYRFSEDLDFTATSEDLIIDEQLIQKLCDQVSQSSGIRFFIHKIKPQLFEDKLVGYEVKLKFWGANHSRNMPVPNPSRWMTSLKIDANWYEELHFPIALKRLFHSYSDHQLFENAILPCYDLRETFAEKMRAFIQRKYAAARDYYDVWFLSQHLTEQDWKEILPVFRKKVAVKNKIFTGKDQLLNPEIEEQLKRNWIPHLSHQFNPKNLESVETICSDLYQLFERLF